MRYFTITNRSYKSAPIPQSLSGWTILKWSNFMYSSVQILQVNETLLKISQIMYNFLKSEFELGEQFSCDLRRAMEIEKKVKFSMKLSSEL